MQERRVDCCLESWQILLSVPSAGRSPWRIKAGKGWDRICFPEDSYLCMEHTLEDKTERDYISVWDSALVAGGRGVE